MSTRPRSTAATKRAKSFRQLPTSAEGFAEAAAFPGSAARRPDSPAARAVSEARQAGLLDGESDRHLSFRVPSALIEAAMRETGIASPTELGLAALAIMAQPDPVAAYFRETFGRLGSDFDLDY